jgi:tetratricopeptide (TPR) repeat protein
MLLRRHRWAILSAAALLVMVRASTPSAKASPASSAAFLIDQAHLREAKGDDFGALGLYDEALAVAPNSEEAHLALARLRARRGELRKALDVLDLGLGRRPESFDLRLERARVRRANGDAAEANADLGWLERAARTDAERIAIVRERIAQDRAAMAPAALLADYRRLGQLARTSGDATVQREADVQVRALSLYLGELDPVSAGARGHDPLRRGLASIARRMP